MIEEYNDNKSYKHEETCTYEGKIWRASCYSGLNGQGGLTGISPKMVKIRFGLKNLITKVWKMRQTQLLM